MPFIYLGQYFRGSLPATVPGFTHGAKPSHGRKPHVPDMDVQPIKKVITTLNTVINKRENAGDKKGSKNINWEQCHFPQMFLNICSVPGPWRPAPAASGTGQRLGGRGAGGFALQRGTSKFLLSEIICLPSGLSAFRSMSFSSENPYAGSQGMKP